MTHPISVIIRTKNEATHIGKVLQRLKEQEYEGSVEIILVDSGSSDNTVRIAESYGCHVIKIRPREFSFGRALNIGFTHAKGEIVINLSGHSVPVQKDYFTLMAAPFGDPEVAATFGRDIPWPEACPSQARDILNHFPDTPMDGSKFSNANAAVRKKVWEAFQFNEALPASEDVLWSRTVMKEGYRIMYAPGARVFHSHTSSLSYAFTRYLKERSAVVGIGTYDPDEGEARALFGRYLWHVKRDFEFAERGGYALKWYLHIPLYRLAQGLGLYMGTRIAEQRRRHA